MIAKTRREYSEKDHKKIEMNFKAKKLWVFRIGPDNTLKSLHMKMPKRSGIS